MATTDEELSSDERPSQRRSNVAGLSRSRSLPHLSHHDSGLGSYYGVRNKKKLKNCTKTVFVDYIGGNFCCLFGVKIIQLYSSEVYRTKLQLFWSGITEGFVRKLAKAPTESGITEGYKKEEFYERKSNKQVPKLHKILGFYQGTVNRVRYLDTFLRSSVFFL